MGNEEFTDIVHQYAKLKKYISCLKDDNSQIREDLQTVKYGLKKVSGALIELEKCIHVIENEVDSSQSSLENVILYIEKKEKASGSTDKIASPDQKGAEGRKKTPKVPKQKLPAGVMIFISPDSSNPQGHKDDSTRESRRQLMPMAEEEQLILSYIKKNGSSITQREYKELLKQISDMLLNAPKNAVAIEIKKIDPVDNIKNLELCYHIRVKGKLSLACFSYFHYKGK